MTLTETFEEFSVLDTDLWSVIEENNGGASIVDSALVLDEGGASDDNIAAVARKEPIDFTVDWVAILDVRVDGATWPGAHSPIIFGILDAAAVPSASMTDAARDAATRLIFENQINGSTAANNRIQIRYKNAAGTHGFWDNSLGGNAWKSSGFAHSYSQANPKSLLRLCIIHEVGSGLRCVTIGYDNESTITTTGARLVSDTDWIPFGTGTLEIDPIDNEAFFVIGDLVNDEGDYDNVLTVERFSLHEMQGVREEQAYLSGALKTSFPFPYNIHKARCPKGLIDAGHPTWLPEGHHPDDDIEISRGANDWVQDCRAWQDADGSILRIHNIRDSSGLGHIAIEKAASYGAVFSSPTTILSEDTAGLDAAVTTVRFGDMVRIDDVLYMAFSTETATGDPMKLWLMSNSDDPEEPNDWSTPVEKLAPTGVTDDFDEDGVAQPTFFLMDDGTVKILYGGYDASLAGSGAWSVGIATASSITGTWTRASVPEIIPRATAATQVDGAPDDEITWNVDDSSGFYAGLPIVAGGQDGNGRTTFRPTKIESIPSGTQIRVEQRLETADNHWVVPMHAHSIAPRVCRVAPGGTTLELYCTTFKFQGGQETVQRFVSAEGELDPETATWTPATDRGYPWAPLPGRPTQDFVSYENIGFINTLADITEPAAEAESSGGVPALGGLGLSFM